MKVWHWYWCTQTMLKTMFFTSACVCLCMFDCSYFEEGKQWNLNYKSKLCFKGFQPPHAFIFPPWNFVSPVQRTMFQRQLFGFLDAFLAESNPSSLFCTLVNCLHLVVCFGLFGVFPFLFLLSSSFLCMVNFENIALLCSLLHSTGCPEALFVLLYHRKDSVIIHHCCRL